MLKGWTSPLIQKAHRNAHQIHNHILQLFFIPEVVCEIRIYILTYQSTNYDTFLFAVSFFDSNFCSTSSINSSLT